MSEETNYTIRLSKAAKEFNVGVSTILEFLAKKGFQVDSSPNTKLTSEMYSLLVKEYQGEKEVKNEAKKLGDLSYKGGSVSVESTFQSSKPEADEDHEEVIIRTNTITPSKKTSKTTPAPAVKQEKVEPVSQPEKSEDTEKEPQIKVLGKIDLEALQPKSNASKKAKEKKEQEPVKQEKPKEEPKEEKPVKEEEKPAEKVVPDRLMPFPFEYVVSVNFGDDPIVTLFNFVAFISPVTRKSPDIIVSFSCAIFSSPYRSINSFADTYFLLIFAFDEASVTLMLLTVIVPFPSE